MNRGCLPLAAELRESPAEKVSVARVPTEVRLEWANLPLSPRGDLKGHGGC